jgi:ABC-2 type transport system ATP-binding protein
VRPLSGRIQMGTDYIALEISGLNRRFTDGDLCWQWMRSGDTDRSVVVLDCSDFQVKQGEILGVLGAEGSGRSDLMHSVAALLVADEGRITVSRPCLLQDRMAVKRLINRVLADGARFRKLTPLESLIYGARLYCLGEHEARRCAMEVLKRAGLDEESIYRPVEDLGPDVQQKVAVICAAFTQPAFLLLDEPAAGLPAESKQELRLFLEELRDVYNATVLLSTRDAQEADVLCDRVAVMEGGQIVALDTPAGLKALVSRHNGHIPTLADAFVELTGKQLVQ